METTKSTQPRPRRMFYTILQFCTWHTTLIHHLVDNNYELDMVPGHISSLICYFTIFQNITISILSFQNLKSSTCQLIRTGDKKSRTTLNYAPCHFFILYEHSTELQVQNGNKPQSPVVLYTLCNSAHTEQDGQTDAELRLLMYCTRSPRLR